MTRPTLIVFARAPAIGVGKSRLARDMGRLEAWRLYRGWAAETLRRLRDPRWRIVVRLAPDRAPTPAGWRADVVEPQGRGGLGERLERAIRAHAAGVVAVIGTDAPQVTRVDVAAAFRGARGARIAIGPADDGGFWILALNPRQARRVRFAGTRWSTSHALEDTVAAVGAPAARLRTLIDVDDGASLRALRAARRRR